MRTMAEQPRVEQITVTKSLTGISAVLQQIVTRAGAVSIYIPAGKGGILHAVSISENFVAEDRFHTGGALRLECSEADWDPFYFVTGNWFVATEGGEAMKPFVFPCFKKMPGKSTVTIDFCPYDNQDQYLEVTLHWIMTEADPDVETFSDIVHPLYADKVSSTNRAKVLTSWNHNTDDRIHIPQKKGGTLVAIMSQVFAYSTTTVVGGGRLEVFCDNEDGAPQPMDEYISMITHVGDHGMMALQPKMTPHYNEVKATSNWEAFYTPRNALPQSCTWGLVWERPYQPKQ